MDTSSTSIDHGETTDWIVCRRLISDRTVLCASPGCHLFVGVSRVTGLITAGAREIPDESGCDSGFPAASSKAARVLHYSEDATLLPGFIDCHVHLTIEKDDYQIDHLRMSSAAKVLRALRAATGLLRAGFTTLRSAGEADPHYPVVDLRRAIERSEFLGPRIVGAGHYISVTGGGGDINGGVLSSECGCSVQSDGLVADGADGMVRAVRTEAKYGADWIKILASGAFMASTESKKDSPERTHMSEAELEALVAECRRRRLPVMAHAHGAEAIALVAKAGVRSIEHASFIDDAGISNCLANGTFIVPTFSVGEFYAAKGSVTGSLDRMIALQRDTNDRFYSAIKRAVTSGVKVALGSDFVGWPPEVNAREFRFLCEYAGMDPLEAIRSGTTVAAELLELDHLVGRIEVGKHADLVVVQGNPLDDITLLETAVLSVFKDGKLVPRYDAVPVA